MFHFAPDNFVVSSERDFAVFVVGACGLSACGLVVLVGLLRGRRLCWGSLGLLASGGPCGRRPRQDDAFEASLREEQDRRRLARALRIIPWAQVLVVTNFLVFTVKMGLDGGSVKRFGSTIQDIALSVFSGIISIMWASQWVCVSVVTLKSLDYWFSALMLCIVVYMSPYAIRADLVAYRQSVIYVVGLFCCLFDLKPVVNIPWLLLTGIVSSCTLLFGEHAERVQEDDYSSQQIVSDGFQNIVLVVCLLLVFNRTLMHIARLELDAKLSRNELAAATSVLGSVCEVVVDLDETFRLQRHSGELADMLFLNPQRSLDQEDIRSFLASEADRSKFTEQMGRLVLPDCQKGDGPDLSKTFQVLMKDSTGISVNVHVFAVSYLSRDGLPAFMVGILEVSDSMPLPSLGAPAEETRRRRQRERWPKQDLAGAPPWAGPPLGPAEEASTSSGSSSGSGCGALDLEQLETEGEAPAVWFDVLSDGYDMLHFTGSFQHLFGPCQAGDQFLTWVKRNHREQFVTWTQESWMALVGLTGGDTSSEIFPRALHFLPTHLRQHRLAFSATVFLDLAAVPGAAERAKGTARMTLSSVRRLTASAAGGPRVGGRHGRGLGWPPQPDGGPHPGGGTPGILEATGLRRSVTL